MSVRTTTLAGAMALILGGIAHAEDPAPLTQPMKMGDTAMACDALLAEAQEMETRLGGSPAGGLMDSEYATNMGTSLAQQAAIRGGAGQAAGAIGAVGGILGRRAKAKKEEAARQMAIAEKRWIYMVGLYQGRACDAPAEPAQ